MTKEDLCKDVGVGTPAAFRQTIQQATGCNQIYSLSTYFRPVSENETMVSRNPQTDGIILDIFYRSFILYFSYSVQRQHHGIVSKIYRPPVSSTNPTLSETATFNTHDAQLTAQALDLATQTETETQSTIDETNSNVSESSVIESQLDSIMSTLDAKQQSELQSMNSGQTNGS